MKSAGAHRRVRSRGWQRRRRRSILFAGGTSAAALLATAFSAANFAGVDVAAAAVERARSFLDLMSQRSPGERVKGALTKTKHRHFRVLAERPAPAEAAVIPAPLTGSVVDVVAPPAALFPAAFEVPAAAALAPPVALPPGVLFLPPGGGIVCCAAGPPPGGPPGAPPPPPPPAPPPPPPPTPPPPPPPPPPAVPEPGTWMTLMLGFGLTGWMLRRRRSAETQPSR